jgi:two-component system cell cycle sensor histidine kinase/response regulator CckA
MDFTGHGTILLVEGEEGLRRLFSRGLRMRGFSVIEASNGLEALKVLEQNAVDLIVSDVVMPDTDGPTLRGRIPNFKILFIPKPFTLDQLVTAVKRTMGDGPLPP